MAYRTSPLLIALLGTAYASLIDANRILQAPIEGIANQSVTNRYLINPWNTLYEVLQILGVEVVTSI
jgi:hypothetical protein